MEQKMNPILIRPSKAAELADVSRPTLYRWMNQDDFPVYHIGGCTRVDYERFKQWLRKKGGQELDAQ